MKNLSPLHAESRVSWLAHTASACLIDEARLSPKRVWWIAAATARIRT